MALTNNSGLVAVESWCQRLGPWRLLRQGIIFLLVATVNHLLHASLRVKRRVVGLLTLLPGLKLWVDFARFRAGRICDFRSDVSIVAQSLSARNRLQILSLRQRDL